MTRGKQPQSPRPLAHNKEEQNMSNTELTSKIRELRELEALIAEAQAEAEALKAALPDVARAFTKQTTTRRFVVA